MLEPPTAKGGHPDERPSCQPTTVGVRRQRAPPPQGGEAGEAGGAPHQGGPRAPPEAERSGTDKGKRLLEAMCSPRPPEPVCPVTLTTGEDVFKVKGNTK